MTLYARDGMSPTDPQSGALIDLDNAPTLEIELDATVERSSDSVEHGVVRIVPANPTRWRAALGRMVGRRITVTLSREKERRSGAAHRFWWVLCTELAERMRAKAQDEKWPTCPLGTKEDVHVWAKYRFLGEDVVQCGGVEIRRPASTTRLDITQHRTLCKKLVEAAMENWDIDLTDVSDRE